MWWYASISRQYQLNWVINGALLGIFVTLWICIGWSWASFAEGELQSGAMGLVCFGLPGVIALNLVWKRLIQPNRIS